jgi:hypothetical protein
MFEQASSSIEGQVRSIARQLAREITADEMEWIAAGTGTGTCTCGHAPQDPIDSPHA